LSKIRTKKYAMSKARQRAIGAFCLACIGFLIWLDHRPGAKETASPLDTPQNQARPQTDDFQKYHGGSFTVSKVIDGDTIDIAIADAQYLNTRIRLLGIDTPETKSPTVEQMYFGAEAAEFATTVALGKNVRVYLDSTSPARDKYDRVLAYIQLPNGKFLNEMLVAEGFAYADLRFRHGFYNKYQQLQALAKSRNKGLWQNITREQLPKWLQRERPKLLLK